MLCVLSLPMPCFIQSVTITCGSIKLTDIELELHTSDDSTASLIYHCAESISANQTITSVCSSDGGSLWNSDPASHGCTSISTDTIGRLYIPRNSDTCIASSLGSI